MKPRMLVIAMAMSGLLLGGCASPLANKSADAAAVQTMEHNAGQSYNFDGQLRIKSLDVPDLGVDPDQREIVDEMLKSFSVELRGAVDLKTSRVEVVPTFRFARPNVETWLRVPLLTELNTMSFWVDASALNLALPQLRGANRDKLVKFQVPQDKVKDLPVDAILAELPQLVKRVYSAVDKKAYTFQPLDERAKQLGASYRIRLDADEHVQSQMNKQMVVEILALVARYGGEHKEKAAALVHELEPLLTQSHEEFTTNAQIDLLVSRSGELLGMVQVYDFASTGKPKMAMSMEAVTRMSNHGHPVFTMVPTAANVVNFSDLKLPRWMGGAPHEQADEVDEVDEADASGDEGRVMTDAVEASAPAVWAKPAARKPVKKLNKASKGKQ